MHVNTKFCSVFRRFAAIPMPHYEPPIHTPIGGGLKWTYGVENGTIRNIVPAFLFDL